MARIRDGTDYFTSLLDGFTDLGPGILGANSKQPQGASLTAENDRIAVRINNAATQKDVDRADIDATNSSTVTMADGLGSRSARCTARP